MKIQRSKTPLANTKPHSGVQREFSYNPQDRTVMKAHSIKLDNVQMSGGRPKTDTVKFLNKKAKFSTGKKKRLIDLLPDSKFKLEPKSDGTFNYGVGDDKFTAANAFSSAARTVDLFNQKYSNLTGKTIDWSFGRDHLNVSPETGDWAQAFYYRDEGGIYFFDIKDTNTGNSGENVAHETGHAILDALRPNYMALVGGLETNAFHEAFGDTLAFLMTLSDDKAVTKLAKETGGDLKSSPNFLSVLAEDFGKVLGKEDRGIRSSFNDFTYKDPATLPKRGSATELGHRAHDFSRLWSGAFLDVIDGITKANMEEGMSPKQALKAAGDEGWTLLIGQMEHAPTGASTTYKQMAGALMEGDRKFNAGKRQKLLGDVLQKRKILTSVGEGSISSFVPSSSQLLSNETTLDSSFGNLAGVKVETLVNEPVFGALSSSESGLDAEVEKNIRMMMQDDLILFSEKETPSLGELFKQSGEAYEAYVSLNESGERQLHRAPIAARETLELSPD